MTHARSMHSLSDDGFTLVELLIVVLIIGILAGIAAPFMLQAKASANEASAIGTMRAINSAQATFLASCGNGRYAAALAQLVSAGYASADMDLSPKSGYTFGLQTRGAAGPAGCDGLGTQTGYYAWAQPISNTTGSRGFATDQEGSIWQDTTGTPPPDPFAAGATIAPLGK